MEFSINMPTRGALGRQDSNPHNTVLEAAVLPLNYVPRCKRAKKNRSSGVPESGSWYSPSRRYTGTSPVPTAYEVPPEAVASAKGS